MAAFRGIIETLKSWNDFLKDMEKLPQKMFQGEFYEEKSRTPVKVRARCSNKVRVEDLRPSYRDSESA